ncbi:MAG: hypothetical protein U0527_08870 [Candidatus Eisenbacteria bacterium]
MPIARLSASRLASQRSRLAALQIHDRVLRGQAELFLDGPKLLDSPYDSLARALSAAESAIAARDAGEGRLLDGRFRELIASLRDSGWRPEAAPASRRSRPL